MKTIKITVHGENLLQKLADMRKKFTDSEHVEVQEAYLQAMFPLETEIIEEIYDANDFEAEQPETIPVQ
tara:strand:- start:244 stop:450 length:207 start_codon:yes stop_codon:yes gene_type:complete